MCGRQQIAWTLDTGAGTRQPGSPIGAVGSVRDAAVVRSRTAQLVRSLTIDSHAELPATSSQDRSRRS